MAVEPLLCLSSGLTPQYRVDILSLLALPRGSYIQFRYEEKLVAENLRTPLADEKPVERPVLLAHVDCNKSARQGSNCRITPCRLASLVSSRKLSGFYFVQFRLEEFAVCANVPAFQASITGDRPHWISDQDIAGLWCFEAATAYMACGREKQLSGWERVIRSLWESEDFCNEPFFFAVEGVYETGKTKPSEPRNGQFALRSERSYLIQLFNFHPNARLIMSSNAGAIKLEASQPHLQPITSPTLPVGSPYDLKQFHFRTTPTATSAFGSIVVRAVQNSSQPITTQPELFIPVKVKSAWFKTAALIGIIAALLFGQQYVSAHAKGPVSPSVIFWLAVLAIATAVVAVLGLKRPI